MQHKVSTEMKRSTSHKATSKAAEALHERSNGLVELAGAWTEEEYERFEKAIAMTEQIDEELWGTPHADPLS
jgi:hypothetical protein